MKYQPKNVYQDNSVHKLSNWITNEKYNTINVYQDDAVHELSHEGVLAGRGADGASGAHAGPSQAAGQAAHAQDATHPGGLILKRKHFILSFFGIDF